MRFGYRLGLATVVCMLSGTLALATPITGSVDFSSILGTPVAVGQIDINFSGVESTGTGGSALFNLIGVSGWGNIGTVLVGATQGTIQDLNAIAQPVNSLIVPNFPFITFNGTNNVYLELEFIYPGTNTLGDCTAVGTECTPSLGEPPFSPFNLATGSGGLGQAEFSVRGYAYNDSDGTVGNKEAAFSGIFTAQFDDTYQAVMGEITDPLDGWVQTSWSGTVVFYAVPEPSTLSFLAIGLALVGAGGFVRRRRRSL